MAAAAAMLLGASNASAQIGHFGVIGGLTFSKANMDEIKNLNYTGFHAGITYQLNLPLGFSIQPELIYQARGTRFSSEQNTTVGRLNMGFVELPVNIQWGPDLVLFRPYLMLTPYIGYAVNNKMIGLDNVVTTDWTGINRFEYGLGLGVGVEIWKFQLSGKYCWSFGNLGDLNGRFGDSVGKMFDNAKFGGFQLSLAFLF